MNPQTEALKPCPLCDSPAELEDLDDPNEYFVSCTGCGLQQIAKYTPKQAIAAWNHRTTPAAGDDVEQVAKWRSIAVDGPPEPEVFVLCWDGRETFVDWFGSKPDAGRGVTHWLPYEMPPGAISDMHDGRRARQALAPGEVR